MAKDHNNEVTAAEIIRNFGFWQSKAMVGPVIVTHHGRPRLVLSSIEAFDEAGGAPEGVANDGEPDAMCRTLSNHMTEGFVGYDENLRIVAVNPAAENFLARSRDELLGKSFVEAFPTSIRGITHERLQRTLATSQVYQFESQSTARPGLRMAVTTFPYPGGVGIVFQNTTEQELLGQNQDCYRAVMDALGAHDALAAARLDSRGRIEEVQAEFAEWLGLPLTQLTNARLYDFAPSKDRRKLQDTLETVWETHAAETIEADFMRREEGDLTLKITFSAVVHDFAVQSIVMVATRLGQAKAGS